MSEPEGSPSEQEVKMSEEELTNQLPKIEEEIATTITKLIQDKKYLRYLIIVRDGIKLIASK